MLFWGTVLSFIISIMVWMVYPRSDEIHIVDKSASESFIVHFATQHQAARDYAQNLALVSVPTATDPTLKNNLDNLFIFDGEAFARKMILEDVVNEIGAGVLETSEVNQAQFPSNGYSSMLICMDKYDKKTVDGETTTWEHGNLISCSNIDSQKYIFTYGRVPYSTKGNDHIYRGKQLIWERALLKRTRGTPDCGFLRSSGDDLFVHNPMKQTRKLPQQLKTVLINPFITSVKTADEDISYEEILVCLTPIRKPYVTEGLTHHFDASINQTNPLTHYELKNSWTNLVDNIQYDIINGSVEIPWNSLNQIPLEMNQSHFLSLDLSKVDTTLSLSLFLRPTRLIDSNWFGTSTFAYPRVFCNQTGAGYLVITVESSPGNTYELTSATPLEVNRLYHIVYNLNPFSHSLYINGRLDAEVSIDVPFSTLREERLTVGRYLNTNGFTGLMYNIKLYNRNLQPHEITYNYSTDQNRYRF